MGFQKGIIQSQEFLWSLTTGDAADSAVATGSVPIFSIPADTVIRAVTAHVITLVAGSTAEIVGDGADDNGYLLDGFAAATGIFPLYRQGAAATFVGAYLFDSQAGGTDALDVSIEGKAKLYTSADTIDYDIAGTATAGKIRFTVEFQRLIA